MASQWPVVHARLLALLRASWPDVEVYDGPVVTGDVPNWFCTVGGAENEDSAGNFTQTKAGSGWQTEETGGVRCELVAFDGGVNLSVVRVEAFALLDVLEQAIRDDQTLGVLPKGSTTELTVDVVPRQNKAGSQQRLPFTVNYFVRT